MPRPPNNGFTATEQRIIDLLSDGMPHTKEEIHGRLWDEMAEVRAITFHISNIRAKLRPRGQDIICEFNRRRIYYRHIRLLASSYDGYK